MFTSHANDFRYLNIYRCFQTYIGGGSLWWKVGKLVHLDGLLSSKGESGSSNGGGGSGGSVLIETTNMTGHGEINVNGGDGQSNAGGGAGGRIGIHVDFQNNFGGWCKQVY